MDRELTHAALAAQGIEFTSQNNGAQLTIGNPPVAYMWPSTQRWNIAKDPHNGKGVDTLVAWLKKHHPTLVKGKNLVMIGWKSKDGATRHHVRRIVRDENGKPSLGEPLYDKLSTGFSSRYLDEIWPRKE